MEDLPWVLAACHGIESFGLNWVILGTTISHASSLSERHSNLLSQSLKAEHEHVSMTKPFQGKR